MPFPEEHLNKPNIFIGALNLDDDNHMIESTDMIDNLNIRNTAGALPGACTNVKGNVLVVNDALPAGVNTVIGECEDKRDTTVFYFVHNSNNEHCIFRYYPTKNAVNPNGEIELIVKGSALNFNLDWKVHSSRFVDSKYLYWTDSFTDGPSIEGNPPRKINAVKGNITGKLLEYELFAGLPDQGQFLASPGDGNQVKVEVYDRATATLIAGFNVLPVVLAGFQNDPYAFLDYVTTQTNSSLSTYVEADYCNDCSIEFTMKQDTTYLLISETVPPAPLTNIQFVRKNHYPDVIREEHLDVIKWPPKCEITTRYIVDTEFPANNVNQTIFQFRERFWFDDGEKSAWGPISLLALPIDKSGFFLNGLNAIELNFTSDRLNNASSLNIISKIEIAFREGNLGNFRSIDVLERCEIGINQQIYNFRNDKLYSVVQSDDVVADGQTQTLKLFDSVPRLSGTMEVMADREGNNRLFYGSNLENYNGVDCVELGWELDTNPEDECYINITGRVDISYLPFDNSDGYFRTRDSDDTVISGFVVYLAGTTYYGISESFEIPAVTTPTGEFEIKNVPKGVYTMRVANYRCRFDDTKGQVYNLNNGIAWQRTSAAVVNCAGSIAATGWAYERVIDLTGVVGNTFDLLTEVGFGPIEVINLERGTFPLAAWGLGEFYIYDNEATAVTNEDRLGSIGVERQLVRFTAQRAVPGTDPYPDFNFPDALTDPLVPATSVYGNMITDHNGFVWAMWATPGDPQSINQFHVEVADVCGVGTRFLEDGNAVLFRGGLTALFADTEADVSGALRPLLGAPAQDTSEVALQLICYNTDVEFTEKNKTIINGTAVESTNTPVPNVLFSYTRNGRPQFTDSTGGYSITVYCPYDSFGRADDTLWTTYPTDNCYEYPPLPNFQIPDISDFCTNPYDIANPFTATIVVFPFLGAIVQFARYLKSGGVYRTGMVYEDRASRKCTVVEGDVFRVPFFTELGVFEKVSPKWSINSIPPDWATHYRIVITKDSFYRRYLQWIAEEVQYVLIDSVGASPILTSFGNGNATHVMIKISSIITEEDVNANPVEWFFFGANLQGFNAQPKDRIRLILDEVGDLAITNDIYDFEIVGIFRNGTDYFVVIETPEIFREIKANWLVELYTPKLSEEVVFYEIGECHEIIDAGLPTRRHEGSTQNQIIGVQPATGFLAGGDTYWRNKNFTVDSSVLFTYQIENPNITDRFDSTYTDIGRPNVKDDDFGERFYFNRIRFSGIYIPDSKINGLSAFKSIDNQALDMRYGNLMKLMAADNVMLAICQFKTQPIYVAKDRIMDLSGAGSVGRSDTILNLGDELKYDFGTQNPESVIEQDGTVYAVDIYQGVVWRYSTNGQFPISKYKAQRFFNDLGKNLYALSRRNTKVYGFYDREYDLYGITVAPNESYVDGFTLLFSEDKNRWNNFMSYIGEYYAPSIDRLISFKDGNLYLHEGIGQIYNNFYGVQYPSRVKFVSNNGPRAVKNWWNLQVQSDNQWYAPSIVAPQSYSYPFGMESEVPPMQFSIEEGIWKADLLRDKTDPDPRFNTIVDPTQRELSKLYEGRVLRGEVLIIELELVNSSEFSILRRADVEHTLSMDTKA